MQEEWIREESEKLKSKNYEVEGAVKILSKQFAHTN